MNHDAYTCTYQHWPLSGERVYVRIETNIDSLTPESYTHPRLRAAEHLIRDLITRGAHPIIITHRGRPTGYDSSLSNEHLLPWLAACGWSVNFVQYVPGQPPRAPAHTDGYDVTLLENIRFYPEEYVDDQAFAHTLAHEASWYINDAWGTMHRAQASVHALALCYDQAHKSAGPTVAIERARLAHWFTVPAERRIVVIGGGKAETKLGWAASLVQQESVGALWILPGIARSLLDPHDALYSDAQALNKHARTAGIPVGTLDDGLLLEGTTIRAAHTREELLQAYGIGPHTQERIAASVTGCFVLYTGAMGFEHPRETQDVTSALLQAIHASADYLIVGGGSSAQCAQRAGLCGESQVFCSTGGGSTLAYIADGDSLPGLQALAST